MRFWAAILAVTLLILSSAGSIPRHAAAFDPPNDRYFAYISFNHLAPKIASTGVLTWDASDEYGWDEWHDIVRRSLDTGSEYADSLGNVLARSGAKVLVREAFFFETPDIILHANTPGYVSGQCGGTWATACVRILDELPIDAFFNAASMRQWPFVVIASVDEHEIFHPTAHACDQYRGGCPPTQGESVQCTSNPDTLMDCGGAARYPQPYDVATFLGIFVVPPPPWAVLDLDWRAVFYGPSRAGPAGLNTCLRTAIYIQTLGFPLIWAGINGPCSTALLEGVGVPILPGTCYWVEGQNWTEASWGRNLTLAGCVP